VQQGHFAPFFFAFTKLKQKNETCNICIEKFSFRQFGFSILNFKRRIDGGNICGFYKYKRKLRQKKVVFSMI